MKCKSVACIWSGSPPSHRVTAAAVLSEPPTLYTGGSDGSVIWWNLVSSRSKQEIKPIAMLCGHAAPIADLGICFPIAGSDNGELNNHSNVISYSNSINSAALISACTDGMLCVWSRASGHCRRRRKMPPWAGSPSMVQPWPENRRYACIACCFVDHEHQSRDSAGGEDAFLDRESLQQKPFKSTVVIVDTYTLTIVQTIFNGYLSIGPLKSMAIILSARDMGMQSVVMIDSFGRVQFLPILKNLDARRESESGIPKDSSHMEIMDLEDGPKDKGALMASGICGNVLALVYRTYCSFRLVDDGTVIGEICFSVKDLCLEDKLHVTGGMFLAHNNAEISLCSGQSDQDFVEDFVVWNNRGLAIIYRISNSDNIFRSEPLSVIPAVTCPDTILSVAFISLNRFLIRVESVCYHMDPLLSNPHVTIWSLPEQQDNHKKLCLDCKMVAEGSYGDIWAINTPSCKIEGHKYDVDKEANGNRDITSLPGGSLDHVSHQTTQVVSSSMVISENHHAPYAIVYGFVSGDIEVVWFHLFFEGLASHGERLHHNADQRAPKGYLSGHTGAILCLAAHQMARRSGGSSINHVLLSGSMDCTVRIWDLDSCNPITVMHHHVAPIRQIILPPSHTEWPWSACFLTVGDDLCVTLISLETLRVERMFPGHPYSPAKVVWDGVRGYIACLCPHSLIKSDALDDLHIWDVKSGARERVLRGAAAHSMFDHFCTIISKRFPSDSLINGNTSASSLLLPITEETKSLPSNPKNPGKVLPTTGVIEPNTSELHAGKGISTKSVPSTSSFIQNDKHPIKSFCPFPGVVTLCFDLTSLISLCSKPALLRDGSDSQEESFVQKAGTETQKDCAHERGIATPKQEGADGKNDPTSGEASSFSVEHYEWIRSFEGCLLQFSLSFLHLWNVDYELDDLLITEMKLHRPDSFLVASGLLGDRGSLTLTLPGSEATLELWKTSSEYSAMRSLTMVSLAQHLISLSHSCSSSSSALAAFYTRKFAEKIPEVRRPLLQLLVSFWQDEFEHVKMAARSLFHCAASRAIPPPLCSPKVNEHLNFLTTVIAENENGNSSSECMRSVGQIESQEDFQAEESRISSWLESFELQDWISCVGGSSQDAMTSHIIVAAALAVWYPSLVKPRLPMVVVHPLMKLVMAMNEKYSSTAAEILAEGMESTWKDCIGSEIPRLIGDIFFQVEWVSGASAKLSGQTSAASPNIRETLVGILLPSLAMADIQGFLHVIESQIWSTASDSPVHVVSLMTLIRVVRGAPRNLAPFLDKVVTFILQTMDPGNPAMRRSCLHSSTIALKEVVRTYPMVALSDTSARLAVGDAIGEIKSASIRVYDMQSMSKIKVLDASGPPGLPNLLGGASEMSIATVVSALSFSPDGEGLVAFSENGLMIRWWSLGSAWWEKLSRNLVPVQCTKLIFVPPWEGFSPSSTRLSIMASVLSNDGQAISADNIKAINEMDRLKFLIHNLDLSYRLEWVGERKVKLSQHGHELGTFLL